MTTPTTYVPPPSGTGIDLDLSRNEGRTDAAVLLAAVTDPSRLVSRYPDTGALRRRLAELNRVEPDQVLVTAGGDDALHRCFLALVGSGGSAVTTSPTFEMIPAYAGQLGVDLAEVPWWSGAFPSDDVVSAGSAGAGAAFVVSPNNPTGSTLTGPDLVRIAGSFPHVVLDAAYGEFADTDLSPAALGSENIVVVRTLSKAYGLAGLRVGYLLGPPELIARIAAHGGPYPVSALSAALAEARLDLPAKENAVVRVGYPPPPGGADPSAGPPRRRTLPVPGELRAGPRCRRRGDDRGGPVDGDRPAAVPGSPGDEGHGAHHRSRQRHRPRPAGHRARDRPGTHTPGDAMTRAASVTRKTSEVDVTVRLDLDGEGRARVATGLVFLDHMLGAFARHGRFDLDVDAAGDTAVDDHHTVEDCAIALGRALHQALGDRSGIARFGHAYAPLDESLAWAVVDLSGRPWPEIDIPFTRDMLGQVATENLVHFLRSFAMEGRMALHVDLIRGDNDHHRAEASFKAVAMALRAAVAGDGSGVPSTKGTLT